MEIERGDIVFVNRSQMEVGSEQMGGRPAIIVSNDKANTYSGCVEIVYLTTQPKKELPTHVAIRSASRPSIALCEQISNIDKERIIAIYGHCSLQEMEMLDIALMISLGISNSTMDDRDDGYDAIIYAIGEFAEFLKERRKKQ